MHEHAAHVIERYHGPRRRQRARRIDHQRALDDFEFVAQRVHLVLHGLRLLVRHVLVLVVEAVLQLA